LPQGEIFLKEHPLNCYFGIEDSGIWMKNMKGDFPSFFAFWKKCKKESIHQHADAFLASLK